MHSQCYKNRIDEKRKNKTNKTKLNGSLTLGLLKEMYFDNYKEYHT